MFILSATETDLDSAAEYVRARAEFDLVGELSKVWSAEDYSEGKDRLEQSLEEVQTGDTAEI